MAPLTHWAACKLPFASVLYPANTVPFALMLVALLLHELAHDGKNPRGVIVPPVQVAA
jgi:hypothetical protein